MADPITPLHYNTQRQSQAIEKTNQQRSVVRAVSASRRAISAENLAAAKAKASAKASAEATALEAALPEPPPMPEPVDARPIIMRKGLAVHLTAKDVFEMTAPHAPVQAALKGYQKNTVVFGQSKLDVRA